VHEHVDTAAPRLVDLLEQVLDRRGVAHVGLHGHGLAARGLDLGHDLLGRRGAVQVVDHHPHPRAASRRAVAAPIPLLAPVTNATLPVVSVI
jgi:hypothetical protein